MSAPRRLSRHRLALLVAGVALVVSSAACRATASGAPDFAQGTSPSPSSSGSATPSPSAAQPSPSPSASPSSSEQFVFPVVGTVSYARTHHDYPATDIMAKCGSTVRAATSGVILEVTRVDRWKRGVNAGATRGGLSVSIKGDDGVRYYGSHLEFINANIKPGVRVKAGQTLGKVGETGDASACHLHFGISPVCSGTGDWWIQRGVIWPWRYLDSWRRGGDKSPIGEVKAWQSKNGCPSHPTVDP
jgi:peptidoglycan LD-endopeptidase LytH